MVQPAKEPMVEPFLQVRQRGDYTGAEQQFSRALQDRVEEVLSGQRDSLAILRRYPAQTDRIGVLSMPADVPRSELRLPVVESISLAALRFVCPDDRDGPVVQTRTPDGGVIERQIISTKYPHIVVERTDCYVGAEIEPTEITWCLRRVQNQRRQTQLNRLLDAANLAFELLRIVR